MTLRALCAIVVMLCVAVQGSEAPAASLATTFEIRTVATTHGTRTVLSSATVTGPPTLAIRMNAEAGPFRLTARFVSRPDGGAIRIASRVETRRDVGRSGNDLPLVEEGAVSRAALLATDGSETLAVFPFGRDDDGELSIEIVPRTAEPIAGGGPRITITDPGPSGWIRIEADVVPPGFTVDAEIVAGGRTIASGSAGGFPDEQVTVPLRGESEADMAMTIDRYGPACAGAMTGFVFDVQSALLTAPVRGWSGVAPSGAWSEYPVDGWPGGAVLRVRCTTAAGPT